MQELRWSAIVGTEQGDLRIEEGGPIFYGRDGARLNADQLRRSDVGLLFAGAGPSAEAEVRLHGVRTALRRAAIPFAMTQMRFS